MSYPQSRSGGGQRGKPCLSPESRAPREQRRVLWSCAQPPLTREVLFPRSLPQENTSTSWPLANAGNLGVETKRYSGSRGISPTPMSTCPEPSSSVSALPCQEGNGGGGCHGPCLRSMAVPLPTVSLLLSLCSIKLGLQKDNPTYRGCFQPPDAFHSTCRTPPRTGDWRDSTPLGDFSKVSSTALPSKFHKPSVYSSL